MKFKILFIISIILFSNCSKFKPEPIVYSPESPPPGMVYIPGGIYMMGSDGAERLFHPQTSPNHPVSVSSFYISKTEIQRKTSLKILRGKVTFDTTSNRVKKPDRLVYFGAIDLCNRLSKKHGLEEVYLIEENKDGWTTNVITQMDKIGYRLPTEAEWEYAARGGVETTYYWGDSLKYYTEYEQPFSSYDESFMVGLKKPNPYGLYDILGNIREYCTDIYDPEFYTRNAMYNPVNLDTTGAISDENGVDYNIAYRGGPFRGANVVGPEYNRVFRDGTPIAAPRISAGFRMVLPTNEEPPPFPDSLLEKYPLRD